MMKRYFWVLIALFMGSVARGDLTAIGNLSATATGSRTYTDTDYLAIAFHTGDAPSNGGWTNFSLTVQTHDGSWPVSGVIELWGVTGGEPGWLDKSFDLPGTQPSGGLVKVTNTDTHKLLENHDYFIVIHATSGSANTEITDDTTTTDSNAAPGWTIGNSLLMSSDGGQNWTEQTGERMQASVQIDVIPEPASLGMMALAGGSILWIRRKFVI